MGIIDQLASTCLDVRFVSSFPDLSSSSPGRDCPAAATRAQPPLAAGSAGEPISSQSGPAILSQPRPRPDAERPPDSPANLTSVRAVYQTGYNIPSLSDPERNGRML